MKESRILIAGSGRGIHEARGALARRGHTTECVRDFAEVTGRLAAGGVQLLLIGPGCPDTRLTLCEAVRRLGEPVPILLLGAAPGERAAVGHPMGPDDYVVRELDVEEIGVRADAWLRRGAAEGGRPPTEACLTCGPLRIDSGSRRVSFRERSEDLTATEIALLVRLARSPDRVHSRVELLREIWGYEHEGYSHTLTTHVNRLRRKLERQLGAPRVVETVRGLGYRFIVPDGA